MDSNFLLAMVPKEPRISKKIIEKLADIIINLGNLCVASVAIPYILDKPNMQFVIGSIILAFIFWSIAVVIMNKYYK